VPAPVVRVSITERSAAFQGERVGEKWGQSGRNGVSRVSVYFTGKIHEYTIEPIDAFIGHALGLWPTTILYGRAWTTTLKSNIDGLIYALLAGGIFGWLWPK
jgi:hypothetical protein